MPCLIGADLQTRGRGRNQHAWWTARGGLTFSLLLEPERFGIHPHQWPLLSIATGLSICRLLERELPEPGSAGLLQPQPKSFTRHKILAGREDPECLQYEVRLKWPNDVYVNGRKICGILLETIPEFPTVLIVGIGLNVNNSISTAGTELQRTATSLRDLTGDWADRTEILLRSLRVFEEELQGLGQNDPTFIPRCRKRCYLTGRRLEVRDVLTELAGTCLGIDDDGALRIMTESGPQRIFAGEILRID